MVDSFALASGNIIRLQTFEADVAAIGLNDLAHHLAKVQRYNGALPIDVTYSVGEHCLNLANQVCFDEAKKYALFHDISETLLADLPSYLKKMLPDYVKLENRVQGILEKKYLGEEISNLTKAAVKFADKSIVLDEVLAIMPDRYDIYERENKCKPIKCKIIFNEKPSVIKQKLLELFDELQIKEPENESIREV